MRKPLLSLASVALVAGACGARPRRAAGYVRHRPPAPPPADAAAAAQPRRDALRRRHLRRSRHQPVHRPRRGPRLDLRDGRRHRLVPIAQRFVDDGNLPDPASVRVEEWVNAFDQGYGRPDDDTFAIHVDGGPSPFLARGRGRSSGSGSRRASRRERARPDAALTFVIDTSGSMAREDRLELVKDSLAQARRAASAAATRSPSSPSATTRASSCRRPGRPTTARSSTPSTRSSRSGSTNLEAGLRLGYELARETLLGDGGDQPGRPRLGRRRQRRADRRRRHPRPDPRRRRGRDRARRDRRRDGQLQRRPARAAGRPGRRLLRLRQRPRRGAPAVPRGPRRDAPDGRPRRQGPGRVRPRRRRRRTGSSATRTGRSPTTTSATRRRRRRRDRGGPRGDRALRHPALRDGAVGDATLGTVRLRWTEPGAAARVELVRDIRRATWPARSARPTRRSSSTRSWPRRPRCCATARGADGLRPADVRRRRRRASARTCRRPTRSTTSSTSSSGWPARR